ncbi:hypothetical protein [Natrinema salifodinae]|uniref:Uncharacterized protein n=1 Tax=Natrinema salifodinae TaxID=1202768 RepID=A0A1I0PKV0_9EURY|nr:hypothetical protein [Natrinema salifodinae]SEW14923.1 hypothetical protein SAMN05216285_2672 [Natrinema salifodinae]
MASYLAYSALVILSLIGCMVALVATTKDTAGGFGTKGDAVLAAVVLGFAIATIGTSVF